MVQQQQQAVPSVNALRAGGSKVSVALQMSTETAAVAETPAPEKMTLFEMYTKAADVATNLFPLWTVLFTGIALKSPSSFDWFTTDYFTGALAALMLD